MRKEKLFLNVTGLLIIAFHLIPIYLSIVASFKAKSDLSIKWALPQGIHWDNYVMALQDGAFYAVLMNTLLVTFCTVALTLAVGSLTGYVLARLQNRITNTASLIFIGVMMVPSVTLIVPLYKTMLQLGAINTYWGIIVLSTAFHLPLCIFMYTNFIKTIPKELDEAAQIDGCRSFSIFYKMILPLLGPVTASMAIITSIATYNEYLFPLYFLQKSEMRMITTYITTFFQRKFLSERRFRRRYARSASADDPLYRFPETFCLGRFERPDQVVTPGAFVGKTKRPEQGVLSFSVSISDAGRAKAAAAPTPPILRHKKAPHSWNRRRRLRTGCRRKRRPERSGRLRNPGLWPG